MSDVESRVEIGKILITNCLIDGEQHVTVNFYGCPIFDIFAMLEMAKMQAYAQGLGIDDDA